MNKTDTFSITIPKKKPFKNVYQFKITLLDANPSVWRRILVPGSYTFYDLHVAIQDSMGWEDYHLHGFEIEDGIYDGKLVRIECPFADPEFNEKDYLYTTEIPLKMFFKQENASVMYYYDYGDGWEHKVLLEKIIPRRAKMKYPVCLDGKMACPPEDCGGIPGYYRCIEAIKNLKNEDGLLDWLGDWKPGRFNPKNVVFDDPKQRLMQALDV